MLKRAGFVLLLFLVPLLCSRGRPSRSISSSSIPSSSSACVSPQTVARDVVVVGIEHGHGEALSEPLTALARPPRRFFLGDGARQPAVLGVDIILPDRSYDSVLPGSDKKLLKGLLDARLSFPVVLGQTVDPSGNTRNVFPLFLKIAGAAGYALFPADRDGVVRRFDERLGEGDKVVPTLAGEMARKLGADVQAGTIDFWRGAPFSYVRCSRCCNGRSPATTRRSPALFATNRSWSEWCSSSRTACPRRCNSPPGSPVDPTCQACCCTRRRCAAC